MKAAVMNAKSGGKSPHCKVCGDDSSGFHYGVDSCEGCKGFFRRCITQGMTHKCANEEKCEITAFTRNSCQYCRLKKCFEVGMSREASRLGRRPKRLKEVGGESSRVHTNLPIAPYPSQQDVYRSRMEDLQKLLQENGTFKAELMQAFLSAAQRSFREHSKSGGGGGGNSNSNAQSSNSNKGAAGPNTPSTASPAPNNNIPNSSINSNSNSSMGGGTSASQIQSPSMVQQASGDISLGMDPNLMGSQFLGTDLLSLSSPSNMQVPSPFPDLSMAELSPMTPNLSMGQLYDNSNFMAQSLNGNTVYSPGPQFNESMPSPLNIPSVDNLDPCSPSTFMTFNTNQIASPDSSSVIPSPHMVAGSSNMNLNNNMPGNSMGQLAVDTKDVLNSNILSPTTTMLSPHSIKQEVGWPPDTTVVKTDLGMVKTEVFELIHFKDLPSNEEFVQYVMGEVKQTPSETRRLLIAQVTDAIVEAHMGTTINIYANVEEANQRIKNQGPPDMANMPKLTMSASAMWQQFLSALLPEITKVVKFCKKLPGFCEIPQDDQVTLIKQGSFEVMVARFCILVDHINDEMLDPYLKMKSPRHVIRDLPLGPFLDEFFDMAKLINPLGLTDGEIGLFTAILMFCPERRGLTEKEAISKVQELYLQALYFLMKHSHKDNTTCLTDVMDQERNTYVDASFSRLIGLIPAFHKINADHAQFLNSIKMKGSEVYDSQFPALHKEIFEDSIDSFS